MLTGKCVPQSLCKRGPSQGSCSVVLLPERDLQTSACKSRVMLLLLFPAFPTTLLLPAVEGSFCRNGN